MKNKKTNLLIVLFFALIFATLLSTMLTTTFSLYDETWNFQSIYKMYTGGTIYNDNNVIITPIFFDLGNIIFHILGANLLSFKIYGSFIYLAKYFLVYFIFRKLNIRKALSLLYTLLFFTFDYGYIPCGANYNIFAEVITLIGIFWYITNYNKKFYHLGQGIIIYFTFFIKQTIGVYYAFGIVLFELLDTGFNKKFFKNQLKKLITFLPLTLISLIIMYFKGNLFNFINLCFGSILEFGSSNLSFNIEAIFKYLYCMVIIIIVTIIFLIKLKNISFITKKNTIFLLCIALGLSFNILPIINNYHLNMSFFYYMLLFIYIMDYAVISDIFNTKSHTYNIILICFLIFYVFFFRIGILYFTDYINLSKFDNNHPFYGARILPDDAEKIEKITNYISEKEKNGTNVIVLSYETASYMVPLGINNNEFDLCFRGNLGYNGIEKTIEKIQEMQNTEFLIFTDKEDCFFQESEQIYDYIINNLEKTGEFLNYSIYINK